MESYQVQVIKNPMRFLPVALAISLVVNVCLVVVCVSYRSLSSQTGGVTSAQVDPASGEKSVSPNLAVLSDALKKKDARTVYDQLRAIGFSEVNSRDLINSMIWEKYHARRREMLAVRNSADQPYWRGRDKTANTLDAGERKELRDLAAEARRESIALLGSAAFSGSERSAIRYSFLPQEKVGAILDLERDYGEMRQELSEESARFKVASDAEKSRVLREEYRRDLEAALTPEELVEYDKRFSLAAHMLRTGFGGIEGTESEYLAAYDAMKGYNDLYSTMGYGTGEPPDPARLAELREFQQRAGEEIKTLLGEERYAEFTRAQNRDYRNLQAAADRFQIPVESINNVYNLRGMATQESQRIAGDQSLSSAAKKQEMQALADQIKSQVSEQLGDEVAAAYLEKNMKWLGRLSSGNAVKLK